MADELCPSSTAWTCLVMPGPAWTYLDWLGCALTCLDLLVLLGPAWTCLDLLGPAWPCLVLLGLAWPCLALLGPAWACLVPLDNLQSWPARKRGTLCQAVEVVNHRRNNKETIAIQPSSESKHQRCILPSFRLGLLAF